MTIAVASVGAIAVSGSWASAQTTGFYASDTPEVTVDMSVLDGGGSSGIKALPPAPGVTGRLLIPGPQAPVSRLYVKPSGAAKTPPPPARERVTLTPPSKGPALPPTTMPMSAMNVPAKSAPAAQPEAKPEDKTRAPKRLVSAPPAPKAAPPAPKVAAPAPAAPAKPAVAAAAPPPPAIEKPQVASAPPAIPAAPVAPPPPVVDKPQVAKAPQVPVTSVPAPPPAPPAGTVAAAPAAPAAQEQASLPKASSPVQPGQSMQILFEAGGSKLTDQARTEIKNMLQGILDKPELRLQLLAYAGGESLSSSKARRLSLSRALAVRSYLIESGLRSTRIDVRALGNKTTEEPVNRVDVNVVER